MPLTMPSRVVSGPKMIPTDLAQLCQGPLWRLCVLLAGQALEQGSDFDPAELEELITLVEAWQHSFTFGIELPPFRPHESFRAFFHTYRQGLLHILKENCKSTLFRQRS